MSDKIATLKHVPKLHAGRFSEAEAAQLRYFVNPEPGTEIKTLLEPSFWAHVAPKLRPYTEITAVPDDNAWYARFLVLFATSNEAKVVLIAEAQLESFEPSDPEDEYEIKWRGGAKFGVIKKADGEVVKDGFPNKEEARAFLTQHAKSLAA